MYVEVELKTRLAKEEDTEKTIYEIHIKNIRKTPGRYYEAIYLATDYKITPKLTIRVFGNIKQKN